MVIAAPPAFQEKVFVITGASRGIGEACARALALQGAKLTLVARSGTALEALSAQLHQQGCTKPQVIEADLTQNCAKTADDLIARTVAHWGHLSGLINNAGSAPRIGLLQEMTEEAITQTFALNTLAPLYCMRAALRQFAQQSGVAAGGDILNINSVAGKTAYPYWAVYDASKFALRALTDAVADEARQSGVRVMGIYPGAVATAIWDGLDMAQAPNRKGMLTPEQVAEAALFMLRQSPESFLPELTLTPLKPAL
ncbi:MAG: SDR family NAD(P)-dependent oxidoreductase [Vampirovibrionales bacterium]|nr:SDR family NAD(P)-dependent oxidoreductase [Vampirovibrionales bacterium]